MLRTFPLRGRVLLRLEPMFRKPQRQTGRDSDSDSLDVTGPEHVLKAEHKRLLLALKVTRNLPDRRSTSC